MKLAQKTVFHIEDDPCLANMVKLTFESFGFTGEFLQATHVEEAFNLLAERAKNKLPVDLILSDMHLPDGRGLDLLQNIKSSPTWSKTPVIILSNDGSSDIVSEAYALGASCYLSKLPKRGRGFEHFRSLYQFWIENALVPKPSFVCRVQEFLGKAIQLRARTAQFYIELSKLAKRNPEQESFWLERAMVEGNLSSLMFFLQGVLSDDDVPLELTERLSKMQTKVEMALVRAEQANKYQPQAEEFDINCSILGLLEAWDEEVFVDLFGIIFPLNQTVYEALKLRGANQLKEIADYVLTGSNKSEIIQRAKLIRGFSGRLERMSVGVQGADF